MCNRTNSSRSSRSKFDHHRDRSTKALINKIFFIFKFFAKAIQNLTTLCLFWVTIEDKINAHTINDRLVFDHAALYL